MQAPNKAELLEAEVDEQDESFFRILVDGRFVKYLTIKSGLFSVEDMCFGPSLIENLPDFPPGDWNDGLVSRDAKTGQPHFARTVKTQFPGVMNLWHDTRVDYCELVLGQKLRTGIYEVMSREFETAAVAKFARFDWEIQYLENETTAYQWIKGCGGR